MTGPEMRAAVAATVETHGSVTLVLPKGFKRPPRFPRGELLCENTDGELVYRFDGWRIIKWLDWAEKVDAANEGAA